MRPMPCVLIRLDAGTRSMWVPAMQGERTGCDRCRGFAMGRRRPPPCTCAAHCQVLSLAPDRAVVELRMQTLGLSPQSKSDGLLQNLFWPTIHSESDVDALGVQGYWVCFAVSVLVLVQSAMRGLVVSGSLLAAFYFFGGIGVRLRSRFAAAAVFGMYLLETLALYLTHASPGILGILALALLLANVRATWLAAQWPASQPAPSEPRLPGTAIDWMSDRLPLLLWPVVRLIFYAVTVIEVALITVGLVRFYFR